MVGNTPRKKRFRSQEWFDNPDDPRMTALYLERYLNFGLTRDELQSDKPLIGIAQTGSDLAPCNRHHIELSKRVRDGIIAAGGIPFEFPCHPIQETGKRPTATLDRNLTYLALVEVLYGYPIDGVVLLTGCDKTTPALMMGAATVNIPAIALAVGPTLNGWHKGKPTGSGTIVWESMQKLSTGEIEYGEFMDLVASSAPSPGVCNTMGTATTMSSLAEALGMQLPGSATIPAPYAARAQMAYETGRRIVGLVLEDLKPSDIMTREAFENAIVVNSAIGGSTNAPIHLNAIAKHLDVPLDNDDWQRIGYEIPLVVNLQPAGQYLGEDFHRAGGVPAVISDLMRADLLPHPDAITVSGKSLRENYACAENLNPDVIWPLSAPMMRNAGFLNLKGNLFDSAIMKTSGISTEFRERYLSNPDDPDAFEGYAVVFDGPEDYHRRIEDPSEEITTQSILVMRGVGPIGYPGGAEVVNMQPPAYLIKQGVHALPCIGDGRQSGTSGSPSILNASPEAALGGGLALLKTGDRIRIDLRSCTANLMISDAELAQRKVALEQTGGYRYPAHQTPWQEIQRSMVGQFDGGMVLTPALKYQRVAQTSGLPRHND
ncbi:MAG: dihydroxy-acid dehydratase family protein [Ensifer sp. SSB1]|nr:dihydroxy-acid dehydratase family protein [Ensifer sp. SSB1]